MYEGYDLLIVDLDGTVRECTVPDQPCPNGLNEQRLLPGAGQAIAAAGRAGLRVAAATNQAGVALGFMSWAAMRSIFAELNGMLRADGGGRIDYFRACTHGPDDGCDCRKPRPGLLQRCAGAAGGTPPHRVLFVGDRESDAAAARAFGCAFMPADEWRNKYLTAAPVGTMSVADVDRRTADDASAARDDACDAVMPGSQWEHHRRGSTYTVLRVGQQRNPDGWVNAVFYEGTDGKCWSRPLDWFLESFTRIS